MAMLVGLLIAWVGRGADPHVVACRRPRAWAFAAHTLDIWRHQVRFIGAGAIGVSAIWTLITLAKPVVGGLMTTMAASRGAAAPATSAIAISLPSGSSALTVVCLASPAG